MEADQAAFAEKLEEEEKRAKEKEDQTKSKGKEKLVIESKDADEQDSVNSIVRGQIHDLRTSDYTTEEIMDAIGLTESELKTYESVKWVEDEPIKHKVQLFFICLCGFV